MTIKNLFAFAFTASLLAGCSKPKSVDIAGTTMYLSSTTLHNSRYVRMSINFKVNQQAEIFAITNLRPMYGDVTVGNYFFVDNKLSLPQIGSFTVKQTEAGFNLYSNGKLTYRLSKKEQPFIQENAIAPQRQYQFASVTKTH